MSQTISGPGVPYYLANLTPNDKYLFNELSSPPLAKIGDHLIYVLDDNNLYYDGQVVATGSGVGDVSSSIGSSNTNYVVVFSDTTGKHIKQADIDTTNGNLSIMGTDKTINMRNQITNTIDPIIRKHHKTLNLGFNSGSTSLNNDSTTIGYNAGHLAEGGTGSVCIGVDTAKNANSSTSNLTAVGYNSASSMTTGSDNTFVGASSALNFTSGVGNTIIGAASGSDLVTGDSNIYVGSSGGAVSSESDTIRIGDDGVQNRTFIAGIYGINNGPQFTKLICADSNTQIQDSSIFSRIEGFTGVFSTTISGLPSMSAGVTYLINYGVGNLTNAVSASSNSLFGGNILASATSLCNQNVCVGNNILYGCLANISDNVCVGKDIGLAAANNVQQNTLIGNSTGQNLNLGVRNVALGFSAGSGLTNNQRCMYLDSAGVNGENNVIRIGTVGTHNQLYLAGITSSVLTNKKNVVMDNVTGQIGYEDPDNDLATCEISFENYVTPYVRTCAVTGTFYELQFTNTTISVVPSYFNTVTPGRIQYIGPGTYNFMVSYNADISPVSNVNMVYEIQICKNGTKIANSGSRQLISNSGSFTDCSYSKLVQLTTNDYVSLFISNNTNTVSINVYNVNIILKMLG